VPCFQSNALEHIPVSLRDRSEAGHSRKLISRSGMIDGAACNPVAKNPLAVDGSQISAVPDYCKPFLEINGRLLLSD
jgi:hypothetical protein